MPLEEDFRDAADRATKLPKRPPNDVLLLLYSLYKQGTEGDVTGTRPGFADFEGRAKYDAWNKLQGKTAEEAMEEYIDIVLDLEKEAAV